MLMSKSFQVKAGKVSRGHGGQRDSDVWFLLLLKDSCGLQAMHCSLTQAGAQRKPSPDILIL